MIIVNDDLFLSAPEEKDVFNYVLYLNDHSVYENMLTIPYEYKAEQAQWFIHTYCPDITKQYGREMNWAIRNKARDLIGGFSIHATYGLKSHKDQIAYWLAPNQRNKGILTTVLKYMCPYLKENYGLYRLEAGIFLHNKASQRVVEKAGFEYEGIQRKAYLKNGTFIDSHLYAWIAE